MDAPGEVRPAGDAGGGRGTYGPLAWMREIIDTGKLAMMSELEAKCALLAGQMADRCTLRFYCRRDTIAARIGTANLSRAAGAMHALEALGVLRAVSQARGPGAAAEWELVRTTHGNGPTVDRPCDATECRAVSVQAAPGEPGNRVREEDGQRPLLSRAATREEDGQRPRRGRSASREEDGERPHNPLTTPPTTPGVSALTPPPPPGVWPAAAPNPPPPPPSPPPGGGGDLRAEYLGSVGINLGRKTRLLAAAFSLDELKAAWAWVSSQRPAPQRAGYFVAHVLQPGPQDALVRRILAKRRLAAAPSPPPPAKPAVPPMAPVIERYQALGEAEFTALVGRFCARYGEQWRSTYTRGDRRESRTLRDHVSLIKFWQSEQTAEVRA